MEPTPEHYKQAKFIQIATSVVKIAAGSYLPSILGSSVTGALGSIIPEWASWTSFVGSTTVNLAGKCFIANGTIDLVLFGLIPLLSQLPYYAQPPNKLTFGQKLVTWFYYPTERTPNGDRVPIAVRAIRYPGEILNASLSCFAKYFSLAKIALKFAYGRQTLMELSSHSLAKEFWVFPELKHLRLVNSLQMVIDSVSTELKTYTEERVTLDPESGEITESPQLLSWLQKKLLDYVEVLGMELKNKFGETKKIMHLLCAALKSTETCLNALKILANTGSRKVADQERLKKHFLTSLGKGTSFEKYRNKVYEKFISTFSPPPPEWFPTAYVRSFFAQWLVAPVFSSHIPSLKDLSEKISEEYPLLSNEVKELEHLFLSCLEPMLYCVLDDVLDEIGSTETKWAYRKRVSIDGLPSILDERRMLLLTQIQHIDEEGSKHPALKCLSWLLETLTIIPTQSSHKSELVIRLQRVDASFKASEDLKQNAGELSPDELHELFDLGIRELCVNFLDFLAKNIEDLVTITEDELANFLTGDEHEIEARGPLGKLLAGYIRLNQKADWFIYQKVSSLILHSSDQLNAQKRLLGLLITFIKNDIISELSFKELSEAIALVFEAQFNEKEKFVVLETT
ncbi:MAG: hypothetical protein KR126chlam1_01360 [Chlamydiae bacterium]|nr:hypothetical protein [Chlamydiota bacterium]